MNIVVLRLHCIALYLYIVLFCFFFFTGAIRLRSGKHWKIGNIYISRLKYSRYREFHRVKRMTLRLAAFHQMHDIHFFFQFCRFRYEMVSQKLELNEKFRCICVCLAYVRYSLSTRIQQTRWRFRSATDRLKINNNFFFGRPKHYKCLECIYYNLFSMIFCFYLINKLFSMHTFCRHFYFLQIIE